MAQMAYCPATLMKSTNPNLDVVPANYLVDLIEVAVICVFGFYTRTNPISYP
jgi:hypothetical protein